MADEAATWPRWIADPNHMAMGQHERLAWPCQSGHGQQWVPVCELPVAKAPLLGLCTGPQKHTETVAVATAPMARQLFEPTTPRGMKRPQPRPPPDPPLVQQHQPVQRGPVQPEVLSQLVEALGQCQQQRTALSQQQTALQQQEVALHQAAMQQLHQEPRPQQHQHMPQQQAVMQQPVAMHTYGMQHAVPMQQAAVQQHLGLTIPLPIGLGLQAMWSQGQGAASGNVGVASCNATVASDSAGAASGRAGAASGRGWLTAHSWPSPSWKRHCPEKEGIELKEDIVKAQEDVNAGILGLNNKVQHKADC